MDSKQFILSLKKKYFITNNFYKKNKFENVSKHYLNNVFLFIYKNNFITKKKQNFLNNRISSTIFLKNPLTKNNNFSLIQNKKEINDSSGTIENVEYIYQKKTPIEHVLLRPDTYIGGIEPINNATCWVINELKLNNTISKRIIQKEGCSYVPGLYKIFDEILVNASDNKQRDPSMDLIKVEINEEKNIISIFNNGKGIPIQMHKEENMYIPELVLGNLFTGSNFNDKVAKVTGGRNGYGAKLTNIFSKMFEVETVDSKRGLKYTQKWTNNMSIKSEPIIENIEKKKNGDYTKITFIPDLEKFGMKSLKEGDILSLLYRRVYDIAACNESVNVYLNNELLPNSFDKYLDLYYLEDTENEPKKARILQKINNRWQVGLGISFTGQFTHISFVNSIHTSRGGAHVNYIADQVSKYLLDQVKKKDKELKLNVNHIKNHLAIYINCLIENPAFDSQTKETLTTRSSHFGSKCILSKNFLDNFMETTNILEHILNWAKMKQQSELVSRSGKMQQRVVIPKLYDANWAGGPQSKECTLILTEGDSAKALAVAGLSVIGRDKFGVFPLRGKLLNVRDANHKQLVENVELNHIATILGLNYDKDYSDPQSRDLRYGKVMLMTDQDHDGSHIKGLFINYIHHFWPSLLKSGDFLEEFITPIVKATPIKNKQLKPQVFFTIPEYENWLKSLPKEEQKQWKIKYYKGLGTSTTQEAKEYFSNLDKHRIKFEWNENAEKLIEMAFKKTNSDQRKTWLGNFIENTYVDHSKKELKIEDFINKELILFSRADNIRSIPSVIDGLKPGQRKVLFACFKRKLKNEIKVAQLAGYVSEHTAYHHGEASLHSTIINMAQNFVGSNNIPLLYPSGQFGTRLQGGKDAASARYLFTRLSHITRKIFPEVDDELLNYLEEDGQTIQPEYYIPIIPLVLVNGAEGLGTGWSTQIPSYNPIDIIDNLILKLNGKELKELIPWVNGFQGTIQKKGSNKFVTTGIIEKIDSTTLIIKELPLNTWIDDYKEFLDSLTKSSSHGLIKPLIKNYTMQHTETSVKFIIKLQKEKMMMVEKVGFIEKFKLESSISINNMHLFNSQGKLKKYDSPLQIIEEFFDVRLKLYEKRKQHLQYKMQKEVNKLVNKAKFCSLVAEGKLKIGNKSKKEILKELETLGFIKEEEEEVKDNEKNLILKKLKEQEINDEEEEKEEEELENESLIEKEKIKNLNKTPYDYLLNIPLWNLTQERINKLIEEKSTKEKELENLKKLTSIEIWIQELLDLKKEILKIIK